MKVLDDRKEAPLRFFVLHSSEALQTHELEDLCVDKKLRDADDIDCCDRARQTGYGQFFECFQTRLIRDYVGDCYDEGFDYYDDQL